VENQHQHIKGYRDLSQVEIDLMNKVKEHGETTRNLIAEVGAHLEAQSKAADPGERLRLLEAQPARWLAMARSELQVGIMQLVRAIAQPSSF
jgi:hypothetical protein